MTTRERNNNTPLVVVCVCLLGVTAMFVGHRLLRDRAPVVLQQATPAEVAAMEADPVRIWTVGTFQNNDCSLYRFEDTSSNPIRGGFIAFCTGDAGSSGLSISEH